MKGIFDVNSTLEYDNETQTFIFTYIDFGNVVREGLLTVNRVGIGGDTAICTNSTVATAGVLTCQVSENVSGKEYYAVGQVDTLSPNSIHTLLTIYKTFRQDHQQWGLTGLMASALLIFTLATAMISSSIAMIGVILIGYFGLLLIGILPFSVQTVVTLVVLGFIIIFKVRK